MATVAHLTSVHSATDIRIFHKECRTLSTAGHEVVLVAAHPRDEVLEGVRVCRLPKAATRFERISRVIPAVRRVAIQQNADLYHIHDPELIPLAWELRLRGATIVYDAHEDLSGQVHTKEWLPGSVRSLVAGAVRPLETVVSATFDGVVAATPAIAEKFDPDACVLVRNFPRQEEFARDPEIPYRDRPETLVYVGGISKVRGILTMVEALDLLPDASGVELLLAGRFESQGLLDSISGLPGWNRVTFLGWLGREELHQLLSRARAGLVTLHPTPNHVESLPIKLFEYMAAGIPVIASDFPLWRKLIEDASCGLLVRPESPEEVSAAIQQLLREPATAERWGRNGRQAIEEHYNWQKEGARLMTFYDRLISN